MLRYSSGGEASRPIFFRNLNTITFIVEDLNDENFYTVLFQRLFGDLIRISKVVGVGGKPKVLERFQRNLSTGNFGNEFYVVDGDLDDLIGLDCPKHTRFYKLPKYDIESCIVDKIGLCTILVEELPNHSLKAHQKKLRFRTWYNRTISSTSDLFAWYAVVQMLCIPSKPRENIDRFVVKGKAVPSEALVKSYVLESLQKSREKFPNVDKELKEVKAKIGRTISSREKWISGKQVLIPLATKVIKHCTKHSLSHESLRYRLAKNCDLEVLTEMKGKALAILDK